MAGRGYDTPVLQQHRGEISVSTIEMTLTNVSNLNVAGFKLLRTDYRGFLPRKCVVVAG